MTTEDAIVAALSGKAGLSTDALCEHAGRKLELPETEYTLPRFKARIYRAASRLKNSGRVAKSKTFNKRNYECHWRLAK